MKGIGLEYIAAGGNRHPQAADWVPGLLAFGAGNNIATWDPEDSRQQGISALLSGHSDTVTAVRIFDSPLGRCLISGSADKTIRVWKAFLTGAGQSFEHINTLEDHASSVNSIAVLPQCDLFTSGAADGTVKTWTITHQGAKLMQSISLKPQYLPLTTALVRLADGVVLLAVAGTTSSIQLYIRGNHGSKFELQATLTGHEGWIRSLDFTTQCQWGAGDVMLASASQDKYIRLWRFSKDAKVGLKDSTDQSIAFSKKALSNKAHKVGESGSNYAVTFDALLIGHEDWVYTVRWAPGSAKESVPILLSASADTSLSMWTSDQASGLWVCSTRVGEISSQKGSTTATGSTGGFWIGLWQSDRMAVVSLGRTGSWRRWCYDPTSDSWHQKVGVSGHTQGVKSLAWAPDGSYLLTTSSDQTTRLFAEWYRDNSSSWHEFARPQIHGYDLNCLDTLTPNQFISGADEKLLRVFNKPRAIDLLLSELSGAQSATNGELPDAANIPVLGLSNKAVAPVAADEDVEATVEDDDAVNSSQAAQGSLTRAGHPPLEDLLARHTLWPEHEKLYGHGYEISVVAASHDHKLVATACKASSIDHAVIRLYETEEWWEVKPSLTAHSLTVTSLAFSHDDQYLLSVGRDRQWAVFQRDKEHPRTYRPLASNLKGHSRMILDCSWAPGRNDTFATAGRDKTVKFWSLADGKTTLVSHIVADVPVTAVCWAPELEDGRTRLAYGTEDGGIHLAEITGMGTTLDVSNKIPFDGHLLPLKAVNALRWRPKLDSKRGSSGAKLAVASEDCSVRIYDIPL